MGEISASVERTDEKDSWTEFLWFKQSFEPADFGSASFGIRRTSALELGKLISSANGAEGGSEESALDALKGAFAQAGRSLASGFSIRSKRPVRSKALTAQPAPPSSDQSFTIRLVIGGQNFDVTTCASGELLEALVLQESEADACTKMVVSAAPANARNLDVLLDVEMPVSISFGKTQLPLRDVFKLTTGSVVELNRVISEPVDIVVNNAVIARGEVVVIEGNFGVRITQVISKQDRLKSLT